MLALQERSRLRRLAGGSALQSLGQQKQELGEICATVEFWINFSKHADPELRAAVKLMRAAQKLMEKSLSKIASEG